METVVSLCAPSTEEELARVSPFLYTEIYDAVLKNIDSEGEGCVKDIGYYFVVGAVVGKDKKFIVGPLEQVHSSDSPTLCTLRDKNGVKFSVERDNIYSVFSFEDYSYVCCCASSRVSCALTWRV